MIYYDPFDLDFTTGFTDDELDQIESFPTPDDDAYLMDDADFEELWEMAKLREQAESAHWQDQE